MKVVEDCLKESGTVYEHLDVERLPEIKDIENQKSKVPVNPARIW
jgi:hypothetical protein